MESRPKKPRTSTSQCVGGQTPRSVVKPGRATPPSFRDVLLSKMKQMAATKDRLSYLSSVESAAESKMERREEELTWSLAEVLSHHHTVKEASLLRGEMVREAEEKIEEFEKYRNGVLIEIETRRQELELELDSIRNSMSRVTQNLSSAVRHHALKHVKEIEKEISLHAERASRHVRESREDMESRLVLESKVRSVKRAGTTHRNVQRALELSRQAQAALRKREYILSKQICEMMKTMDPSKDWADNSDIVAESGSFVVVARRFLPDVVPLRSVRDFILANMGEAAYCQFAKDLYMTEVVVEPHRSAGRTQNTSGTRKEHPGAKTARGEAVRVRTKGGRTPASIPRAPMPQREGRFQTPSLDTDSEVSVFDCGAGLGCLYA